MTELLDLSKKRGQDVSQTLKDIFTMELDMSDESIKDQIKGYYDNYKTKVFSLQEKIILLSGMGQYREAFSWFMGDLLVDIEDRIYKGEYTDFKSLNQFYDNYADEIGISKGHFYECMNIRRRFNDMDTFFKNRDKKKR